MKKAAKPSATEKRDSFDFDSFDIAKKLLSSSTKSTFEPPKKTFAKASPATDPKPKPKATSTAVQTTKVVASTKETATKSSNKDEPKSAAATNETSAKGSSANSASALKSDKKSPKTTIATTGTKTKATTTATKKDDSFSIAKKLLGVTIDNPTPVTAPKGQASSATNDKPKTATSKATPATASKTKTK